MLEQKSNKHSGMESEIGNSNLILNESFSVADENSNKLDFNLNSRTFTNYNLIEEEQEECEKNILQAAGKGDNETYVKITELGSKMKFQDNIKSIDTPDIFGAHMGTKKKRNNCGAMSEVQMKSEEDGKCLSAATISSTPKPESEGQKMHCYLNPIGREDPANAQPELLTSPLLKGKNLLCDEEIKKKFQDLSFAFKTDSMTIQKRLHLLKRKRDQAEVNIGRELEKIKAKLKTLQYLSVDVDHLTAILDLNKELEFLLNATEKLCSSAEAYGYTQHEERTLDFINVMVQHVENVEKLKNEASKTIDKFKVEVKRSQNTEHSDSELVDDRILPRRSVATVVLESSSKRRASIATLPRVGFLESCTNFKVIPSVKVLKKLSFSHTSPSSIQILGEEGHKGDLVCSNRRRIDSKIRDNGMRNIEEIPEQAPTPLKQSTSAVEGVENTTKAHTEEPIYHLPVKSTADDHFNGVSVSQSFDACFCIRKIIEWNKVLFGATRFRWPETSLQYLPFCITWYAIFILTLVFVGGLFTGVNACFIYLRHSYLWFGGLAVVFLVTRFYRFFFVLLLPVLLTLAVLLFVLTKTVFPVLTEEEVDHLFRTFGLVFEIRYPDGPPPI